MAKAAVEPTELAIPEKLLLDIKGAALALSCSVWSVRNLIWCRKVPYLKLGRKFLFDPADLRAFIQRQKEAAS
jgi:hypothetical protein